jgi:hypothetical protein
VQPSDGHLKVKSPAPGELTLNLIAKERAPL